MEKHYADGTEPTVLPHFHDTYPAEEIKPVRACRGSGCQQGRKLCPHPEECLADVDRRMGCRMVVALAAAFWGLIILVVWGLM